VDLPEKTLAETTQTLIRGQTFHLIKLDNLRIAFPFVLLLAYGIFHCAYFFLPDYSDHYRLFGRMVFPLALFTVASSVRHLRHSTLFQLVLAYMLYLLLTCFWADVIDWYRLGQKLTLSIYLVTLITSTCFLVRWNPRLFDLMLCVLLLVAALAAVGNMLFFYSENAFPTTRLEIYGSLTNQNEFSNIYGVFGIMAMGRALVAQSPAVKLTAAAIAVLTILFIWLNQSRTAFVALLLAMSVLTITSGKGKQLMRWSLGALVGIGVGLAFLLPEVVEEAMDRGTSLRPQIWLEIFRDALETPILGHGLTQKVAVQFENIRLFETAHNAYLQVFWQGGVIGLGIFLLLLYVASRQAWETGQREGDMTIFCILLFTMTVMLTGVDTLIERPRDQWILFWLPVVLLLANFSGAGSSRPEANGS
jgi:O-antigen ligase